MGVHFSDGLFIKAKHVKSVFNTFQDVEANKTLVYVSVCFLRNIEQKEARDFILVYTFLYCLDYCRPL